MFSICQRKVFNNFFTEIIVDKEFDLIGHKKIELGINQHFASIFVEKNSKNIKYSLPNSNCFLNAI